MSVIPLTKFFLFACIYLYEGLSVLTPRRANNASRLDVEFCLFVELISVHPEI